MEKLPNSSTFKKVHSYPIYRNFEKEGAEIHESLDELVSYFTKLMDTYNFANISKVYFRAERKNQETLSVLYDRFFNASLAFLKKRFTRLPTMDERSRVKMTNNLLHDFENVYKKNNLPYELLYEIIRSLKYWEYYQEAAESFAKIKKLSEQMYPQIEAQTLNITPHNDQILNATKNTIVFENQKMQRRLMDNAYDLIQSTPSEFPFLREFNAMIIYFMNHELLDILFSHDVAIQRQAFTQEETPAHLEILPTTAEADEALFTEYVNMDYLSSILTEKIESTKIKKTTYTPDVIKKYNEKITKKTTPQLFNVFVSTQSHTAYREVINQLTFTSALHKGIWRSILPLDEQTTKSDENTRAISAPYSILPTLPNPEQFLVNVELIKNPQGELRLASAPLFPLRTVFYEVGLKRIYDFLESQVQSAHMELQSLSDEEETTIKEEITSPLLSIKRKISSLIQMKGTITTEEYIATLTRLGFIIEQGNGSHKKASHPNVPHRPITITHNEEFPFSLIKKDLTDRDIPVEYFIGTYNDLFKGKEKEVLQDLPPLEKIMSATDSPLPS